MEGALLRAGLDARHRALPLRLYLHVRTQTSRAHHLQHTAGPAGAAASAGGVTRLPAGPGEGEASDGRASGRSGDGGRSVDLAEVCMETEPAAVLYAAVLYVYRSQVPAAVLSVVGANDVCS